MENIIELNKVTKKFGGITALNKASLHVTKGEVVGLIGDNGAGKSTLIKTLVGVYGPDEGQILIRGKEIKAWNALKDVTMKLKKGEIMCLLGDNGAGKSTLIKTLAGVHKPDEGEIIFEDKKIIFDSPRDALDIGIGTVYQDLALVSLMSVTRNFFMGREPQKGLPLLKTFDIEKANKIAAERMGQIGIDVRDPSQAVGTMSGGERQCLAISRAIYFGAKVLVLDEPTSALGVHQASMVLKYIVKAASQGLAVILITHNVHHAYPVGNSFTVLNRGKSMGTFQKKDISREKLLGMMAGGEELDKLEVELKEMDRLSQR